LHVLRQIDISHYVDYKLIFNILLECAYAVVIGFVNVHINYVS